MNLIIFDLDGTLTQTNEVDDRCFPLTFADHLGVKNFNVDWSAYSHGTDTVVFREAFFNHFGRVPHPQESQDFERHFFEAMAHLHTTEPERFTEVDGAKNLLQRLQGDRQWAIALATGCWKLAAEFKCKAAGISLDDIPQAYAGDGHSREAIVTTAIRRATEFFSCKFERIVCVGDRIWDVATALNLKLPFLGVGKGSAAHALKEAGAHHVIENYLDPARVIALLEQVTVPGKGEYAQR